MIFWVGVALVATFFGMLLSAIPLPDRLVLIPLILGVVALFPALIVWGILKPEGETLIGEGWLEFLRSRAGKWFVRLAGLGLKTRAPVVTRAEPARPGGPPRIVLTQREIEGLYRGQAGNSLETDVDEPAAGRSDEAARNGKGPGTKA